MSAITARAAEALTLTRAEAVAVSRGLIYTDGCVLDIDCDERAGCYAAIRRLQLEAAINDAGGWWDHDHSPGMLDMYESLGKARCPESFDMAAGGVAAIVELLPWLLADAAKWVAQSDARNARDGCEHRDAAEDAEDVVRDRACMEALEGLAVRLGVELPAGATA